MRVNLLPTDTPEKTKPSPKSGKPLFYIGWGICLLIAFVFLLGEYFDYDLSKGELSSFEDQIVEDQSTLADERGLQTLNQDIQKRQQTVIAIIALYQPWSDILKGLYSAIPEEIQLSGIETDNPGKIIVKGQSLTFTAPGTFLKKLREIQLFKSLKLNEIKRASLKDSRYFFVLELETGRSSLEYSE
ncbi:MAG TPA: PilN domain-containing protein [Bacillota bacterium]|nr:PilN domain-containing protein [Bacillota bacterium]